MLIYTPLKIPIAIKCVSSDILRLNWRRRGITADFIIPDNNEKILNIQFSTVEVIRILDELALSTEVETTPQQGHVSNNLAYEIYGSTFLENQSEVLKLVFDNLRHYRFITGGACLDVLSREAPQFALFKRDHIFQ